MPSRASCRDGAMQAAPQRNSRKIHQLFIRQVRGAPCDSWSTEKAFDGSATLVQGGQRSLRTEHLKLEEHAGL